MKMKQVRSPCLSWWRLNVVLDLKGTPYRHELLSTSIWLGVVWFGVVEKVARTGVAPGVTRTCNSFKVGRRHVD